MKITSSDISGAADTAFTIESAETSLPATSRRNFLRHSMLAGGGLVLGSFWSTGAVAELAVDGLVRERALTFGLRALVLQLQTVVRVAGGAADLARRWW